MSAVENYVAEARPILEQEAKAREPSRRLRETCRTSADWSAPL